MAYGGQAISVASTTMNGGGLQVVTPTGAGPGQFLNNAFRVVRTKNRRFNVWNRKRWVLNRVRRIQNRGFIMPRLGSRLWRCSFPYQAALSPQRRRAPLLLQAVWPAPIVLFDFATEGL